MKKYTWYATIAPHLEPILLEELSHEGIAGTAFKGGVYFEATLTDGAQLVLELFTAGKIRLLLSQTTIRGLGDINKALSEINWSDILHSNTPCVVDVQTKESRFFRTDIIQTKAERCLRSLLGFPDPNNTTQTVFIHIEKNTLHIYLDAGGGLLHKRGWRTEQGKAPLRETYACAMLIAAGWTPEETLFDPCCGSGTIPIEAGRMAHSATNAFRKQYPVEDWKLSHKPKHRTGTPTNHMIFGSDNHLPSIAMAQEHSRKVGIDVQWSHCSIAECSAPTREGLLITNPPYGLRLGKHVDSVYRELGNFLKQNNGWRAIFLTPSKRLANLVSQKAELYTTFSNGGTEVGIWFVQNSS